MLSAPASLVEPATKRAAVFIDGQNLYHCARECFDLTHPDYDLRKLSQLVCDKGGWMLSQINFYSGFPDAQDDAMWNRFWTKKLLAIRRQGITVFSRPLRYRNRVIKLAGNSGTLTTRIGEEKGIDVRIAIDIIRKGHRQEYDVAVVFSQDQDLSEVATEIRQIAREQHRWLKMVSAYPAGTGYGMNNRGINNTDWVSFTESEYKTCIDPFDYRK